MRVAAAALALLLLIAHGAAAADTPDAAASTTTLPAAPTEKPRKSDPEIGRCVKRTREDQQTCVRAATERCRTTFESTLPDCFEVTAWSDTQEIMGIRHRTAGL